MSLKATSIAALIIVSALSQSAFAARSTRTVDQEIVDLTEHVDQAEHDKRISIKQAQDIKRKEGDIVTKAEDLRDDHRGDLRPQDARMLKNKLFKLDDMVSHHSRDISK